MRATDQQILERIAHLDEVQKTRVLEFIDGLKAPREAVSQRTYSALELMALPLEERNRLAIEALERSQDEDVEPFDAYDESDFDDQ